MTDVRRSCGGVQWCGCVCGRGDGGSARVGRKIASKKVLQNIIGKGASKVQVK